MTDKQKAAMQPKSRDDVAAIMAKLRSELDKLHVHLDAVEAKCTKDVADSQRKAMQMALEALTEFTGSMTLGHRYSNAGQMALADLPLLRDALAEPGAFIQKGYKIVPIKPPEDALEVARRAYRNASVYDVAHVWHAIITALPDSPPPLVPLITDAEILSVMRDGNNCNYNDEGEHVDFARAIEQLVRQKVGIK